MTLEEKNTEINRRLDNLETMILGLTAFLQENLNSNAGESVGRMGEDYVAYMTPEQLESAPPPFKAPPA